MNHDSGFVIGIVPKIAKMCTKINYKYPKYPKLLVIDRSYNNSQYGSNPVFLIVKGLTGLVTYRQQCLIPTMHLLSLYNSIQT